MGRRGDSIKSPALRGIVAAALAGALFALAGHLGLIRAYGTVLPFRDQWQATGFDLLGPWANGELTLAHFFTPLNDHWPVLTRALSFFLLRLNGQWNNLVETTFNALLLAGCVALFLRLILPGLRGWSRAAFAVLTGSLFALPITWENTLWGIQSLVYSQIALSLLYFAAVCTQRTFSLAWWLGHMAGLVVLFTQHSAILAHAAVAVLLAWRWWRHDGDRRVALAGLGFALAVIAAFIAFFPSITVTAALRADSWELALDVFLRQLAWPLPHPAWAFVVYAPWLVWTINRLAARRIQSPDAFILVCGLWVGAQAAAIGYGRAAETFTFASRYCDFLSFGWLLNAACLFRLVLAFPAKLPRLALAAFSVLWLVAPLKSFWWETTESHAGYNLLHRPDINRRNLERLQLFYATHDASALVNDPGTAHELFTYPPSLPPLLSHPRFQAVLPPETGSPLARSDHGRLGWLPALLLPSAPWLALGGLLLLGVSMLQTPRLGHRSELDIVDPTSHTPRTAFVWLAGTFLIVASLALSWHHAFVFDSTTRLRLAYAPLEEGVFFADLEFERHDGGLHHRVAARGAVDTFPTAVRPHWYGTRLKIKPDFQGIIRSLPFPIRSDRLFVPFTGHPSFPGNGLRIRFLDPTTGVETWEGFLGPNPGTGWNVWSIDTSAHRGSTASLFLYDGLDGPNGWLGVARPAQTDDPTFGDRWRAILRAERAESTHRTLAILSLLLAATTAASFPFAFRKASARER